MIRTLRFLVRAARAAWYRLQPLNERLIVIQISSASGSNGRALYEFRPSWVDGRFDVRLLPSREPSGAARGPWRLALATARFVVSGHGHSPSRPGQEVLELWHGFPLKGMGLQDRNPGAGRWQARRTPWGFAPWTASYSPLYSTLMSACFSLSWDRFLMTGLPRLEWLAVPGARDRLEQVLGWNLGNERVVFFLPTFRQGYQNRVEGAKADNLWGFDAYDAEALERTAARLGITLVYKLHPLEERRLGVTHAAPGSRLVPLRDRDLEAAGLDLYQVLAAADAMITDYSSVAFDYLVLDRPLVFLQTDRAAYEASRGFLLAPLEEWQPGEKISRQSELEAVLERLPGLAAEGKAARSRVLRQVLAVPAAGASERLWDWLGQKTTGENR